MKRSLKINLVLGQQLVFPPTHGGGVENLNWMLAREFVRLGHEVVVYSRAIPGLLESETDGYGIRHIRLRGFALNSNIWFDHANAFRWAIRLLSVLEEADVTSFHTPFSFLLRFRPKIGICTHTIHRTPKAIVPLYRKMSRVYCGGDAVVRQALAIDPAIRNLKRIYNCVAIPEDAVPPLRMQSSSDRLLFLFVGRFVRDKGLESLIKGFELSLKNHPNNRLVTIGPQCDEGGADTKFFDEMASYIDEKKLRGNVELLPPIFDKNKLSERVIEADVICVPSLSGETFSMAVLEGMAKAKPVLVSDFGSMPEAVDHLMSGYVSRAGDGFQISEAISFFSDRREEIVQLGKASFLKAQKHFSSSTVAQEYIADFRQLGLLPES